MGYGIFQVIETSHNICQYPIPIDPLPHCIKIQLQLSYCFSNWIFNTINVYRDGGWEKIPKEDLPAPSSVSAAFPASWLLLEYGDGCLAGCPHLTGSRIFKSSTSSDQMMYNTCNSITDD